MSALFALAPWLLLAVALAAAVAPWLVANLGRGALAILALAPGGLALWFVVLLPPVLGGETLELTIEWIAGLNLTLDVYLDALAVVMGLVISIIGAAVLVYSVRYFPIGDDGLPKYAGSLLAFVAAMVLLVLADNMILLVSAWEITGVLSYLLIAHRVRRQPSRTAASQALMVSTTGGLSLLLGVILLGTRAGTFRLSEILADPPSGGTVTAAVVLMIVGAISKSALIPFHFWLPGAMAAPTPASAYLHAATMVKAGIYLFARLTPAFAALGFWRPTLLVLGGATMVLGGYLALRQQDLKLLLAYGTVSQLGLMTLILSGGDATAVYAAAAVLIAHALFKAPLFFVIGIVNTTTGTRNLTELSGLGRRRPWWMALAAAAGLSMAGLPPMIGFAAKEAGLGGLLGSGGLGVVAAVTMTIGSILTVAYTLRLLWGAFADKEGVAPIPIEAGSWWMTLPTVILIAAGLVFGLWPAPVAHLLEHLRPAGPTTSLALWHGWTLPLLLSTVATVGGVLVFTAQRRIERRRGALAGPGREAGAGYRLIVRAADTTAVRVTAGTQRGSLPVSLGAILAVLVLFPGGVLMFSGLEIGAVPIYASIPQALLAMVAVALAATLLRASHALGAVLIVGGIGYAIAVFYALRGAPDLALTQLLVETITLIAAVLVLVRMPATALWAPRMGRSARWVRVVLASLVGAVMTALALTIPGYRIHTPVSDGLGARALAEGGGANVVNVILVDIRGWDTFGEISVLVAAAVGVSSLIFLRNPWVAGGGRREPVPRGESADANPSPWLTTDVVPRHSLLLEVATRLIFHLVIIFSLYVLFVGHDEPGGGFSAGLIASIALTLRYLAGGRHELTAAAPVDAGVVIGTGLSLAAVVAGAGLLFGSEALTSVIWQVHLVGLGEIRFVTSTVFDIGVYFVVVGVILEVLRSFGAELDRQSTTRRRSGSTVRRAAVRS